MIITREFQFYVHTIYVFVYEPLKGDSQIAEIQQGVGSMDFGMWNSVSITSVGVVLPGPISQVLNCKC